MRTTRTLLVAGFLMVALLSPLYGAGKAEGSSGSGESGDEMTELSLLIDNQSNMDGINEIVAATERELGITLEVELRPGGSEGDNVVKTRLATGDMADLSFYNSGSLFQALNPDRHFVDLSGESFMERISESFKDTVRAGDGVYAIPAEPVNAGGWFYNKRVYEELGLEVPSTWDELMDNLAAIEEAGIEPVVASFSDAWTSQLIVLSDYYNVHSENPDFAEDYTHNRAGFADTQIARRGFEKMQEIADAGHFSANPASTTYEDGIGMLANGEAAHYPMLSFMLPILAENYPDAIDDIGYFGQPGSEPNDHGATLWMPAGIAAYQDGSNVEAAVEFLSFYASPTGAETYLQAVKPSGPFAIEGVELPSDSFEAVQDMMTYVDAGRTAPALEFLSPVKGPNLPQILVQLGMGLTSAQDAADEYDRDVEKQARQLGLEGW